MTMAMTTIYTNKYDDVNVTIPTLTDNDDDRRRLTTNDMTDEKNDDNDFTDTILIVSARDRKF